MKEKQIKERERKENRTQRHSECSIIKNNETNTHLRLNKHKSHLNHEIPELSGMFLFLMKLKS